MNAGLDCVPFSPDHLQLVQPFECGDDLASRHAADWIKNSPPFPSALRSMRDHGTEVWLYFLSDRYDPDHGYLVGFASLGVTRWPDPPPSGPRQAFGYMPMLAVATTFQGNREFNYANVILDDIIAKARERGYCYLCLHVHKDNGKAIRFYDKAGFERFEDADDDGLYKMRKSLSPRQSPR